MLWVYNLMITKEWFYKICRRLLEGLLVRSTYTELKILKSTRKKMSSFEHSLMT